MKFKFFLVVPLFAALLSCVKDNAGETNQQPAATQKILRMPDGDVNNGVINVKFKAQAVSKLSVSAVGGAMLTGVPKLDAIAANIKMSRMERTFGDGGEFEKRWQKAGLDLWYTIYFDEAISVSKAAESICEVDEIAIVEPSPRIVLYDSEVLSRVSGREAARIAAMHENSGKSTNSVNFNDPMLSNQWHYHNDGSVQGSAAGSDINLFPAWEVTTGHPDVIVCVVDEGVDYNHPDIAQNMWSDVEGNHGYNFVSNSKVITPGEHGTHVAGTIAAVNNNGVGLCGIAGGNGSPNSGVRIMSAQVFSSQGSASDAGFARAIVFGADNGAVISQNSWGYTQNPYRPVDQELPQVMQNAIDYFIENAGTDKDGNQTGPMKGGVIIFAAGNDNISNICMPGAYGPTVAVASCGPKFSKASYSNYGKWVDITAPGGEGYDKNDPQGVWSTLPDGEYGAMAGTSMACPHISGVAALIVSQHGVGKTGFTNTALRDLLERSVLDEDIDSKNTKFKGKLGSGYVDALKAVNATVAIPPAPVSDFTGSWAYTSVDLSWSVTANPEGDKAHGYDIILSKTNLAGVDFHNPPKGAVSKKALTGSTPTGGSMSLKIDKLEPDTRYYVAIRGYHAQGASSEAVVIDGTTIKLNAPYPVADLTAEWNIDNVKIAWSITGNKDNVKAASYDILIAPRQLTANDFKITAKDVRKKTVKVENRNIGDQLTESFSPLAEKTKYWVAITGLNAEGDRSGMTIIEGSTTEDRTPVLSVPLDDIYFSGKEAQVNIDFSKYFTDDLDTTLDYEITSDPKSAVLIAHNTGSNYIFTSQQYGQTKISVKAKDSSGHSVSGTFSTVCRDDSRPMDLYPNPVRTEMNIRLGQNVDGVATVKMYNSAGYEVLTENVKITTFEPGKIDVSRLRTGNYSVIVTYKNKQIKGSITKY